MRFGILGDAKIAREKLVPAMRSGGHDIVHLGKRDASQSVDKNVWQGVRISTYEDMLNDPEVEAVYNPLPNHLHVEWTIKALEAGKHVLCEKPLALTLSDIDKLKDVCRRTGLYAYEAFMVRHHPQWLWLKDLDIGSRQVVMAQFSYPPLPEGNVRNFANMGGGPVWDIGCYCLLSGVMLFGEGATLLSSSCVPEVHLDVEKSGSALVDFGKGRMLSFVVSSNTGLSQFVRVIGTKGWAELDVPFNPPETTTARWGYESDGKDILLSGGKIKKFPACDHYKLMVDDFAQACVDGRQADFTESRILTSILGEILNKAG